ncbi:unnamed protein product [Linum tenue]|uniref:Syntaxin N-terminal domain-containing protein n=1 Tax=Linum tenue TaxID=586396 RepID=A0AAV0Q3K5_9ROSI|nr:unnamed protein product [Linum tenue]
MNEFFFFREIMSDYKKDLRRKYFVVTGEEPNEEMMEKIASGSGGVELMLTAAAKGRNTGDLQREERHQTVVDIQRSLTNLYDGCISLRLRCWENRSRSITPSLAPPLGYSFCSW